MPLEAGDCDAAIVVGDTDATVLDTILDLPYPILAVSDDLTEKDRDFIGGVLTDMDADVWAVYGWDAIAELDNVIVSDFRDHLDALSVEYMPEDADE